MSDGPNGVRGTRFFNGVPTACIPCGTGLGSSWNADLMNTVGNMMGKQAKAKGVHVLLGPTINMQRYPLGGRSFESFSEDPHLSGKLAASYCNGVHSTNTLVCPKHLVCNDKEDMRMTLNAVVTQRALREIYLKPFMIVFNEARPEMFMTSYSKLNGKHCSENKEILDEICRSDWGFDGVFVSDWFGVVSCAESINSGLDLEMPGPSIWRGRLLEMSLFHNTVSEITLNNSVRNILKLVKKCERTGVEENAHEGELKNSETREVLKQAAREGIVLLKNEDNVLPFSKDKRVLLVGEAAVVASYSSGGCNSQVPYYTVSVCEAMGELIGQVQVDYVMGAPNSRSFPSFGRYSSHDNPKGLISFCVYNEPRSHVDRTPITEEYVSEVDAILGDYDASLLKDPNKLYAEFKCKVEVPKSGYYSFNLQVSGIARLYVDGRLEVVNDLKHNTSGAFGMDAPEIFHDVYLSAENEHVIEVDFESTLGESSFITGYGTVKCGMREAYDIDGCILEAAKLAKGYDQVVIVTGLNKDYEFEGLDRTTMDLPPFQDKLIEAVVDANPQTVVVIESGTAVTMPWVDKVSTLVHSSYNGNEVGRGLAEVLLGDYNPSGKLPATFPTRLEDSPAHLNWNVDGGRVLYGEDIYVGYRFFDKTGTEPLFPFGFGLSYTTFEFSGLEIKSSTPGFHDVSIQVKNTGDKAGAEVVQVYVSFSSDTVSRVPKELKAFEKIFLEPSEKKALNIPLEEKYAASFFDEQTQKWVCEAGTYHLLVANSSKGPFLNASFQIKSTYYWSGV